MKKASLFFLSGFTAIAASALVGAVWKRESIRFALLSPEAKFQEAWSADLRRLDQAKLLPPSWKEIREIEVRSEPSPAREWLEKTAPPIPKNTRGRYRLQLFAIHWIDGFRYGVTLEYALVDQNSGNTVWETARTLKLGFVY